MESASQIIDAKITYKTVQEVERFEKALSKGYGGSLKERYVFEALDKRISNLVSKFEMDEILGEFCGFEIGRVRVFENGRGAVRGCMYCVYM